MTNAINGINYSAAQLKGNEQIGGKDTTEDEINFENGLSQKELEEMDENKDGYITEKEFNDAMKNNGVNNTKITQYWNEYLTAYQNKNAQENKEVTQTFDSNGKMTGYNISKTNETGNLQTTKVSNSNNKTTTYVRYGSSTIANKEAIAYTDNVTGTEVLVDKDSKRVRSIQSSNPAIDISGISYLYSTFNTTRFDQITINGKTYKGKNLSRKDNIVTVCDNSGNKIAEVTIGSDRHITKIVLDFENNKGQTTIELDKTGKPTNVTSTKTEKNETENEKMETKTEKNETENEKIETKTEKNETEDEEMETKTEKIETITKSEYDEYSSNKYPFGEKLNAVKNANSPTVRENTRTRFLDELKKLNLSTSDMLLALNDLRGAIRTSMSNSYTGDSASRRTLNSEFNNYEQQIYNDYENIGYKKEIFISDDFISDEKIETITKSEYDEYSSNKYPFGEKLNAVKNANSPTVRENTRTRFLDELKKLNLSTSDMLLALNDLRGAIRTSMSNSYTGDSASRRTLNSEFNNYEQQIYNDYENIGYKKEFFIES